MSLEGVTVSALTSLGLEHADAVVVQRALADFEQGTDAAQVQADPEISPDCLTQRAESRPAMPCRYGARLPAAF